MLANSRSRIVRVPVWYQKYKIKVYRAILLSVFYGCETWSLTFKKEQNQRVFENMVLKIFMLKRDEVTVDWGKLQSEDLDGLYSSPSVIRLIKSRIEMDGVCGTYGREERRIRGFSGKT